jgi:PAS domain S-box-containing protein
LIRGATWGIVMGMSHAYSDDLAARLTAYQDRLEAAEKRGASSFAQAWDDPPPGIGVHEIDSEMRVLRANAGDLRLLGYSREEFVGKRVLDFIVMTETAQRSIGRKISGDLALKPFIRTFKRKDGTAVALVLLDRYLKDAKGQVTGLRTVLALADRSTAG